MTDDSTTTTELRQAVYLATNERFPAQQDETVRLLPDSAGLYNARGTAHLYTLNHDKAIADYSRAIELEPYNPSRWRLPSHAYSIPPIGQPEKAIADATRAIELDPDHHMGYGHRAIAYALLPTQIYRKRSPIYTVPLSYTPPRTTRKRTGCELSSTSTWITTPNLNETGGLLDSAPLSVQHADTTQSPHHKARTRTDHPATGALRYRSSPSINQIPSRPPCDVNSQRGGHHELSTNRPR